MSESRSNRFDLVKAAQSKAVGAAPLLLETETQYELGTAYAAYIGKLLTEDPANPRDAASIMERIGTELASIAFQATGTVIPTDLRQPLLEILGLDEEEDDDMIRTTSLLRNDYIYTLELASSHNISVKDAIERRVEEARQLMGLTGLEEL